MDFFSFCHAIVFLNMMWTTVTVLMLIATSYSIERETGLNTLNEQSATSSNSYLENYGSIEKRLSTCAVPSKKMFMRPEVNGTPVSSEFDMFCYHRAVGQPLALSLCQYYNSLVEGYYGQYCTDPNREPMDASSQYQQLVNTPHAACTTLVAAVVYTSKTGDKKPVFSSVNDCETICQQSVFCTNLAYVLSLWQNEKNAPISYSDIHVPEDNYRDKRSESEGVAVSSGVNTPPDEPSCYDISLMCDGGSSTAEAVYGPFSCWDAEQDSIPATCFPPSGSLFTSGGTGDNMVRCTCTDDGGLQSECNFWVQVDVDLSWSPCDHMECKHGGTCENRFVSDHMPMEAHCLCPLGFTGEFCAYVDRNWDPCGELYCENGGTCLEAFTSYLDPRVAHCSCLTGYYGDHCEMVDRSWDPCEDLYCENGGTCFENYTFYDEPRVAYCACRTGFEGKLCDYGEEWEYARKDEEGRGHFLTFLVVSIILIILVYIVYHNKTKIKNYYGDIKAERKAKKRAGKVNYNVYIRLEERT